MLELEESQIFDDDEVDTGIAGSSSHGAGPIAATTFPAQGAESDDDDDAGHLEDLELDGDSSDSERLAQQLVSMQSSVEQSAPIDGETSPRCSKPRLAAPIAVPDIAPALLRASPPAPALQPPATWAHPRARRAEWDL